MRIPYLLHMFYEIYYSLWLCNAMKMCYTHDITLQTVPAERGNGDRRAEQESDEFKGISSMGTGGLSKSPMNSRAYHEEMLTPSKPELSILGKSGYGYRPCAGVQATSKLDEISRSYFVADVTLCR